MEERNKVGANEREKSLCCILDGLVAGMQPHLHASKTLGQARLVK